MSQGVRTEYLKSVFPAESFPAWQTIQTGRCLKKWLLTDLVDIRSECIMDVAWVTSRSPRINVKFGFYESSIWMNESQRWIFKLSQYFVSCCWSQVKCHFFEYFYNEVSWSLANFDRGKWHKIELLNCYCYCPSFLQNFINWWQKVSNSMFERYAHKKNNLKGDSIINFYFQPQNQHRNWVVHREVLCRVSTKSALSNC